MNETRPVALAPEAAKLLGSVAMAVVVLKPDLTIFNANPAAEQMIGKASRKLSGKSLFEVMEFEGDRVRQWLSQVDTPISAHAVPTRIDGKPLRPVDITLAPVANSPGWQVMTLHEASNADGLGETEELPLRAPAILAHEIKNPLSAIRGAAQLLDRKLGEDEKKLTRMIAVEVDRIAKLIDRMQSLGREQPEPVAPCNLHEVIRRAKDVFLAADDSGVRLAEEFDPSIPPVLANEEALVQVLLNLMTNARDACRDSPDPTIRLRTRFVSGLVMSAIRLGRPIKLPVEIRVSDNGPGVPSELRDHIFEPFVTSKKNGQGLGLALVSKLVRDMNARIVHERDDGEGLTHFRVHLPVAR